MDAQFFKILINIVTRIPIKNADVLLFYGGSNPYKSLYMLKVFTKVLHKYVRNILRY
jgi:hypothetical protein